MLFCLGDGKYESSGIGYQQNLMIFNKKVSKEVYNNTKKLLDVKNIKLPIVKWVEYKDLSKDDQTSTAKQMGGLLKQLSYEDAWKEMWNGFSADDKNFFKSLPNFDSEIFEKITSIKIEDEISMTILNNGNVGIGTTKGKRVSIELEGKKYNAIIE